MRKAENGITRKVWIGFLLNEEYGGWHNGVQKWVRDLNHLYQRHPALWQQDQHPNGFEWLVVDDAEQSVLVFARYAKNRRYHCCCV